MKVVCVTDDVYQGRYRAREPGGSNQNPPSDAPWLATSDAGESAPSPLVGSAEPLFDVAEALQRL